MRYRFFYHILFMPLIIFRTTPLFSGEIVLPSNALDRNQSVPVVYRTNSKATGKGELSVRWTDAYGRLVEDRKIPVELVDEAEIGFSLDLRRAVAMKNDLGVHFSFEGIDKKGRPDHRDENSQATFIARPPDRSWWDYVIMMWQPYSRSDFVNLKTLGINGGQYNGKNRTPPDFLLDNDLRWYAENIATDFYSEYHRWHPDRPTNWKFTWVKELYKKDPASKEAFKRHPSLTDAAWLEKIRDRLIESAKYFSRYLPVFYSLGDETGIADLAASWDFDFSDESLVPMRRWLQERYGTLTALNRQWATNVSSWELVTPATTNEAMKRTDDNFSSWADFKEWMDIAYARALKIGADAVHSVDPDAYVGIGGAQMPGWGGYDYYRMTQALTAIEPYDIGNNIEIIRSLNPKMAVVTTAFAHGPWEKHRVWYELLHGNRGLILWDDKNEFVTKEGTVGARGREVEPYYTELRSGIAALVMNSERLADPIAIHYSQSSMRTEWMLAHRPNGDAWMNLGARSGRIDNEFLRLRESYCRLIEDLGLQYNFVAYGQIEQGELLKRGYRVLILPGSTSLSAAEAHAMLEFVEQGGVLIADGNPGEFDEHSRRLATPSLADLFDSRHNGPVTVRAFGRGKAIYLSADVLNYHRNRLVGKEGDVLRMMAALIRTSGIRPEFAVTDESGRSVVGVETHLFRNGEVYVVGLLTNPQLRVDELGPPEFKSNAGFEKPRTLTLVFPTEMYVYDVRGAKALGKRRELAVALDPYEPAVFSASPTAFSDLEISAPSRIARGETGRVGLSFAARSPAATHVFHVDVVDPSDKLVPCYSGNILAAHGRADTLLPLALNDPPGKWEIRVKDLISGQMKTVRVDVK
jgi:hypothetical protein